MIDIDRLHAEWCDNTTTNMLVAAIQNADFATGPSQAAIMCKTHKIACGASQRFMGLARSMGYATRRVDVDIVTVGFVRYWFVGRNSQIHDMDMAFVDSDVIGE